jgi:hypothetical protein
MSVTWTVTADSGTPRSFAVSRCTRPGFCVGDQISQRPPATRATVFCGSTEACAWKLSR